MKVEVSVSSLNVEGREVLPQAKLLTGATGYVLAVQIGEEGYSILLLDLFKAIIEAKEKEKLSGKSEPDSAGSALEHDPL